MCGVLSKLVPSRNYLQLTLFVIRKKVIYKQAMWICKQSKEIVKAADDFSFYHLLQELKILDNYTGKHALYLGQSKK